MTLALDGQARANANGGSTTATATLTTTSSNDVILAFIGTNNTVISVVGGGLTWLPRASSLQGGNNEYLYYAIASSPLTTQGIAFNTNTNGFTTMDVFGVSGANTATPFDGASSVTGSTAPLTISTTNTNTMIIGGFWYASGTQAQGAGYTLINSIDGNVQVSEYKIVSTTQTNLSVTVGSGTVAACIADAIVQAAAAGGDTLAGPMSMIQMKRKSFGWTPPLVDHRNRPWRRNRLLQIPSTKLWTPRRKLAA